MYMCWLSSTCQGKSNYEIIPTTMMANFPENLGDDYHLVGWWVECLARRLMAIIIACCAAKIKELLNNDLSFSFSGGNLRRSLKKQQKLKKSATRAVYFLSKLLFKPHPSPPLAHSRLRTPLSPKIEIKVREGESPTLNISQ